MADWGIKVVNAGTSTDSTDIRDLILSSKYTMLKYHSDGTINVTLGSGVIKGYGTVAHNLGYVPFFVAYVNHAWFETTQRMLPFGHVPQPVSENAFADTANIYTRIDLASNTASHTFTFRVIVFKDKLA